MGLRRASTAAYVWSRAMGPVCRAIPAVGVALLPLLWPLYLTVAGLRYSGLTTVDGAAILVDRPTGRRCWSAVALGASSTVAGWLTLTAVAVGLAARVDPVAALLPVACGALVLHELAGDWVRHPLEQAHRELELARLHQDGAVRLATLGAWPRHNGSGSRLLGMVCADLDARGDSAALCCVPGLSAWYESYRFRPAGAALVREPLGAPAEKGPIGSTGGRERQHLPGRGAPALASGVTG